MSELDRIKRKGLIDEDSYERTKSLYDTLLEKEKTEKEKEKDKFIKSGQSLDGLFDDNSFALL